MPDETTNTNPASTEPVEVSTPEPASVVQEAPSSATTGTMPVEVPFEPTIAPSTDPVIPEVTNTTTPTDSVPGQNPAEIVATEDTVVSLEPVKNEKVTPHQNLEIPNLGGQAVDLNTAHTTPKQNSEIPTSTVEAKPAPVPEHIIETPPHQNLEIPNLGGQESELLAAEIAQRKLLKPSNRFMRWLKAKSVAARKLRAQKKSDKIIALFNQHEKITNELVRKNLHFPKQTAGNHLELLEKEGKIKQVGSDGPKVFYVKV